MLTDEQKQQWAIKRKFEVRDYLFKLGHSFDSTNEINTCMKISPVTKVKSVGKQRISKPNPGKGSVNAQPTPPATKAPQGTMAGQYPTSNMAPTPGGPMGNYPPGQVVPVQGASQLGRETPPPTTKTRPTKGNVIRRVAHAVRSKNPQV